VQKVLNVAKFKYHFYSGKELNIFIYGTPFCILGVIKL